MSRARLDATLQAAVAEGLLPAGAALPAADHRAWPIVLMMGLGAWLSAIPLVVAVALLMGDWVIKGAAPFFVGSLVLAAAATVLRSRAVPLFVEQLALPFLVVGLGVLGIGLFEQMKGHSAALLLALLTLGAGAAIPRAWLRVLLGAAAAVLVVIGWHASLWQGREQAHLTWWSAWHVNLLAGLAAQALRQQAQGRRGHRTAAVLEPLASGWLLATLCGLAWWSGTTFLGAGANLGWHGANRAMGAPADLMRGTSLLLAAAGVAWAAWRWEGLRRPVFLAMLVVPALLASFMPALGAALLLLCVCAVSARWLMAGAASLSAAWIVGSFYYQLSWPLADKALLLAAAGAVLGALAWLALRGGEPGAAARAAGVGAATADTRGARAAIAASALAVLAIANLGIWQKQDLIAHGQPVYVALAPVDPRSLMQGDYMRLDFRLPGTLRDGPQDLPGAARAYVVASRDARGVAALLRAADGKPLSGGEFLIELTPKGGNWMLVSDAWFFAEGQAERYARARFGEFRVAEDGRALLVGLRDAELRPL